MTVFYLVRHGAIVWGPGDPVLSATGRAQAAAVGAYLKDKPISCVFTSPLRRAMETAEIIAHKVGAPMTVDTRLRERMNWGDVAGQNWAEFNREWARASHNPDYIPLSGLSARQAATNLEDFLRDAAGKYPETSLVVVAHAGILGDFLVKFFTSQALDRMSPAWKAHQGEAITHCSVTTLRWESGRPHLEALAVVV